MFLLYGPPASLGIPQRTCGRMLKRLRLARAPLGACQRHNANTMQVYYTKEDIRTAFGVRRVPKEEVSEEACASPSSSHGTRLEGEGASVESCCPLASDERGLKKVSSTLELSSNRSFISKCNRAIIVYDANSRESFEQLDFWTKEIYRQVGDAISVLLIANRKAHRGGSTIVSSEEGREYAGMRAAAPPPHDE